MRINSLPREEVFRGLVTAGTGLSRDEAQKRLVEFGPNEIREVRRTPLPLRFILQFTHFLAVLLWIAAGLSFLSEYLHPGTGMLALGLAILGVIFINAVFTFIQEYRAEQSIRKLRLLLPFQVLVLREGAEQQVPASDVVPGDVVLLSGGNKVPADARLVDSASMAVNNAPLTGESEPVPLTAGACDGELLGSANIVFAGTTVVSGSGRAVVFATGMRTEFGRIAHLTSGVEAGLSPLQREIVKATRVLAAVATAVGVASFIFGLAIGRPFWENFIFAIGVIVALVPEGLLPTVTLALAMGSQRMVRRKALIKNLSSVETLGSVTVICTDKTGTLTENRMEVKDIRTPGNSQAGVRKLMEGARLCNNARPADGGYRGDPTEIALLRAAGRYPETASTTRLIEIPFDAERKRMTTVHAAGDSREGLAIAYTKGALEGVLPLCTSVLINNEAVPMDEHQRKSIINTCHSLMDRGLRVLSFARRELGVPAALPGPEEIEADLTFLGLAGIEDPPRPEVPEAIIRCRNAGIRVIMLTGDGSRTAVTIGREIGLVTGEPVVIEGAALDRMTDRELRERLAAKEVLFARMTPKHKMRVVSVLKEEGERVAVTGDGVNDAPALKKADIGIAMGIAGTDVAKEAADMVLLDDNFATIVNAIEEGRTVYANIRKFITYILTSNVPELAPSIVSALFRIPLPLTIMQILAVDLGTDIFPALALGAERPTPDLMRQPPRSRDEKLLSAELLGRAYLFLGPIEAAAGIFGYFLVLFAGGWQWGAALGPSDLLYRQATTACLTAIIITQIGNVFACRSFGESVFRLGLFSNRLVIAGIAIELALQFLIVYTPFGNAVFSTGPIPPIIWLSLVPFALALLGAEELRKLRAGRSLRQ